MKQKKSFAYWAGYVVGIIIIASGASIVAAAAIAGAIRVVRWLL